MNSGLRSARAYLAGASQAWLLSERNRLDDEARAVLDDDHPKEILQQYIVLSYPGVAAAKAALTELRLRLGVSHVEIDKAMEFSWTPNDYYFAIDPASAGYYQWGMRAMRFPQAWDKSQRC